MTKEHTHKQTHANKQTHTYIHTHSHTHVHTYTHQKAHKQTHTHTKKQTRTHTYTNKHKHKHTHVRTHTDTYTHTHTFTLTHTHIHTHTHLHARTCSEKEMGWIWWSQKTWARRGLPLQTLVMIRLEKVEMFELEISLKFRSCRTHWLSINDVTVSVEEGGQWFCDDCTWDLVMECWGRGCQ
jgi:hypothetical protein